MILHVFVWQAIHTLTNGTVSDRSYKCVISHLYSLCQLHQLLPNSQNQQTRSSLRSVCLLIHRQSSLPLILPPVNVTYPCGCSSLHNNLLGCTGHIWSHVTYSELLTECTSITTQDLTKSICLLIHRQSFLCPRFLSHYRSTWYILYSNGFRMC